VADTSVDVHVGEPAALVRAKRSPQLAACPSMVTCVGDALTKIDPLRGGAPVATLVMSSAPHTGSGRATWLVSETDGGVGVLNSSTEPTLVKAATSTDVALYAMASVPLTLGAWVSVVTSRVVHELSVGPVFVYKSRSPTLEVVTNDGTSPGMTIGSLATVTLELGIVVVVGGFVEVVVDTGLVVVVAGFVVVVPGFVVVVTGLVVVVAGLVVVVTGLVVVVAGLVVVVVGVGACAVTVTLPAVAVMNGTGWPCAQPSCSISMVFVTERYATRAVRPLTKMLGSPFAALTPLNALRSVAT
jgi:hypothetical protein